MEGTQATSVQSKPWLWKPGQSGNPGGKPKGVAARVRAVMDLEEAVGLLAKIARNEDRREKRCDQIAAIKIILAYGYGQPQQTVTIEQAAPNEFKPEAMSREQRDQLAALLELSLSGASVQ